MSEHINVDHAFDPEARQAQAELDAYMDTRPYKGEKGSIHNPSNGQFANYDDYLESKRDDHYDRTSEAGDYSDESLENLAKRVAQARHEGDKTRANDAEEAFFNKFTDYSDKYNWEDDDSAGETSSVNHKDIRNRKAGRGTLDDRLERYSRIMYGDQDLYPSTAEPIYEAISTQEDEVSKARKSQKASVDEFDQNDSEALRKILAEEDEKVSYVPKHGAEHVDEDSPIFDKIVDENGESHRVAREGESLDEYEARQLVKDGGRHRLEKVSTDGLDIIDASPGDALEKVSTDGLDVIETLPADATSGTVVEKGSKTKLSLRDRLRRLATPSGLAAELSSGWYFSKEKLGKHKKATIGLGILAVAGGVAALYLTKDAGAGSHGQNQSGGNAFAGWFNEPGNGQNKHSGHELLNSNAWNIPKGSGGEALMERLGADKSTWYQHQNDFLNQFPSEAYRMPDGNVGFDDPGKLSNSAIKFWSKFATK